MSRIVVCDTGPLLHLDEASAIHLLEPVGQILIPMVVIFISLVLGRDGSFSDHGMALY